MALLDALLIAAGAWLLVLFVAGIINNSRHRHEQKRSGY
jgi:hypothetical protein